MLPQLRCRSKKDLPETSAYNYLTKGKLGGLQERGKKKIVVGLEPRPIVSHIKKKKDDHDMQMTMSLLPIIELDSRHIF